jgi:hypothetical protein
MDTASETKIHRSALRETLIFYINFFLIENKVYKKKFKQC